MYFPPTLLHGAVQVFACHQHLVDEQHLAACQVSCVCGMYLMFDLPMKGVPDFLDHQVLVDTLACYLCCSVNLQQKGCSF